MSVNTKTISLVIAGGSLLLSGVSILMTKALMEENSRIKLRNTKIFNDMRSIKLDLRESKTLHDDVHAGLIAANKGIKSILDLYENIDQDISSIKGITDNLDFLDETNHATIEKKFDLVKTNIDYLVDYIKVIKKEVADIKGTNLVITDVSLEVSESSDKSDSESGDLTEKIDKLQDEVKDS